MVLERLVSAKEVLKDPLKAFTLGIVISLIALFIASTVFPKSTGLFTVIIITIASVPLMNRVLRYEQVEDEKLLEAGHSFFEVYGDIILAYVSFFGGMILAMSLLFVLLPENVAQKIFDEQINEINIIRGKFEFDNKFLEIVVNNLSVLALSFLFSFLFGSGAIFILSWNASVLSAAIGLIAKSSGGVKAMPSAVMMFLPHGTFEIGAYFIGAIAGGLVSAALTRRRSMKFSSVIFDSFKLLLIAFLFILIGGFIETLMIMV